MRRNGERGPRPRPMGERELAQLEAVIRAAARNIVESIDAEGIPVNTALAIVGVVAGELLERAEPYVREEFMACLEGGF